MLQHALGASQRIMMNLRPPILDQGLVAAVQWLANGFERRSGLRVNVRRTADRIEVSRDAQLVAYRTAQEALTNIGKHAGATEVRLELKELYSSLEEAKADVLVIDSSHAHSKGVLDALARVREAVPDVGLIVGNVGTEEGARALIERGADAIKVGIGPGSICTPRVVTGAVEARMEADR